MLSLYEGFFTLRIACMLGLQSCTTMPGSSVYGILQARILEWIGIPLSRGSSNQELNLQFLTSPALAHRFFTTSATGKPQQITYYYYCFCCSVTQLCPLFATSQTAASQASLSFTVSWSLLKLMSIESVMPANHLIFCHPLLPLPSIFSSIRVFSNVLLFTYLLGCARSCLQHVGSSSLARD